MRLTPDGAVRPSWWRYLRAYVEALEDGPVTYAAIARRMGVTREQVWRLRRRHPGMERWAAEQLAALNRQLVEPVLAKMAALALRGSREHAELFLRYAAQQAEAAAAGSVNVNVSHGPQVIMLAVPRPGGEPVASSSQMIDVPSRVRREHSQG